jgi:E3 ubiquitin-protein ligase SHPRH
VTPPTLAAQWADELAAHAPDLKVFVYQGWAKLGVPITEADVEAERVKRRSMAARRNIRAKAKRNGKGKGKDNTLPGDVIVIGELEPHAMRNLRADDLNPILDWPSYINQFDVCITTYNVLRLDLTVARAPPKRPRRQDVEYKILTRPRSPLVMCEWYRVIMDEVQMMGTGRSEFVFFHLSRIFSLRFARRRTNTVLMSLIPGRWFLLFPVYLPLPSPEPRRVPRSQTSSAFFDSCA